MGLDTKTYCLTDRQSQCNFDFEFESELLWDIRQQVKKFAKDIIQIE
jgi:hypothetical protein